MSRLLGAAVMLLAATLSAHSQSAVPPDVLKDLAPTGKMRAAINFGNGVLAQKGPNGEPRASRADLAAAFSPSASACRWSSCPTRRRARCSRAPRPAPGISASSPSSRFAPPRSSSPRPMSSSTAPTWCARIRR